MRDTQGQAGGVNKPVSADATRGQASETMYEAMPGPARCSCASPPRWLRVLLAIVALIVWWKWGAAASFPIVVGEFGGGGGGGDPDVGILSQILAYVWSVLVGLIGFLNQVLNAIVDQLIAVAKTVAREIVQLGKFFVRVWSLLRRFWTDVLRPVLVKIGKLIETVKQFLERLFKPIIDVITKVRSWLQKIYNQVLRPILDIIDAFRLFLRGLGALGVDWAKDLDQKLGQLEDKLTAPLLTAIRYLNQLASLIDRIMTLDGLFQKLIWIQSLAGYRKPTINFLWNSHSTPIGDRTDIKAKYKAPSKDVSVSDLKEAIEFKGGPLQEKYSELAQQMRIWLGDL